MFGCLVYRAAFWHAINHLLWNDCRKDTGPGASSFGIMLTVCCRISVTCTVQNNPRCPSLMVLSKDCSPCDKERFWKALIWREQFRRKYKARTLPNGLFLHRDCIFWVHALFRRNPVSPAFCHCYKYWGAFWWFSTSRAFSLYRFRKSLIKQQKAYYPVSFHQLGTHQLQLAQTNYPCGNHSFWQLLTQTIFNL